MSDKFKDLAYWKNNAEEDYKQTPISVLKYISKLEEKTLEKAVVDSYSVNQKKNNERSKKVHSRRN